MKQPSSKGNLIQSLLLFAVIFLGLQLFMGGLKQPPDTSTLEQVRAKMIEDNQKILDVSIASEHSKLDSKIDEALKAGKLTQAQADAMKVEGSVLVADTQYKAGVQRNDTNRLTSAYQTLHNVKDKYGRTELWTQPVNVPGHKDFPETSVTPKDLFEKAVEASSSTSRQTWQYKLIDILVGLTGRVPAFSYAFAALLLATIVRAIVWPLAQRQLMWSRQMSQLGPLIQELRKQYEGVELNTKTMELYKDYGINPAAGCLPMMFQMPLFLIIYNCMLQYRFEFQKGTFLWISPGGSAATNGFLAPNLGEKDYVLLVIYGITMVATTLLSPISDPANAKQQRLTGLAITVFFSIVMFFWPVPSAFVLYWIFTNIYASTQSLRAYRMPMPPLVKVMGPNGGALPVDASKNGIGNGMVKTGKPVTHKAKKKRR